VTRVALRAAVLAFALSGAARAFEGVVEISQARALAGGITSGDLPGYPVTLSRPGSYRLASNLRVTGSTLGVSVEADGVSLDLNGFALFGTSGGSIGISIVGRRNVEVRDGSVVGFGTGIREQSIFGLRHRVLRVRLRENVNGIWLPGTEHRVEGCTVIGVRAPYAPGSGIEVGERTAVRGNVSSWNDYAGVSLGADGTVVENVAYRNGDPDDLIFPEGPGISGSSSVVARNVAYGSVEFGISSGTTSSVVGNAASENGGFGLGAGNGPVEDNAVYHNLGAGILASGVVRGNAAQLNQDGIQVGPGAAVWENAIIGSSRYGILSSGGPAASGGNDLRYNATANLSGPITVLSPSLCSSAPCP
jgi:hypothetical protein